MSIVTAYFYTSGGRITGTRTGNQLSVETDVEESENPAIILEGGELSNVDNLYVDSVGELSDKSTLTTLEYPDVVPVGNDIVITGLPEGTLVTWPDSSKTTVNSGSITLEASVAALYEFTIDHPAYVKEVFTVNTDPLGEEPINEDLLGVKPNDIDAINVPADAEILKYNLSEEAFEWIPLQVSESQITDFGNYLVSDVNTNITDSQGNNRLYFIGSFGATYIQGTTIELFRDQAATDEIASFGLGITFKKTTAVNAEFFAVNHNSASTTFYPDGATAISYGSTDTFTIERHTGSGAYDTILTCDASGDVAISGSLTANGNPVVEETSGSWTPVLYGTTTAGSHTYASQTGTWVRHGSLMYVDCIINISSMDATMAGDLRISGLPVSADGSIPGLTIGTFINGAASLPAAFQQLTPWIVFSEIRLRYTDTGGAGQYLDESDVGSGFLIRLNGTYKV